MAPMNHPSHNNSNYGEDVVRRVNVLASCYLVDGSATLKGLHYCTTSLNGLPSPPSSPPLAAITSTNELAILPRDGGKRRTGADLPGKRLGRRGGAALSIREECERFFCGAMASAFHGERSAAVHAPGLMGADDVLTPPPDDDGPLTAVIGADDLGDGGRGRFGVAAWLEVWDYAGGASFRAFVASDGEEKSLFAFFDVGIMGRDLKKSLMALIELAEMPLACSKAVICIDRRIAANEAKVLMRSLQWVGFELTTLDHWAHDLDVTSEKWVFMGMDV